ncbi:MAG: response regulator transcription factor [Betaproteobacteria bacterium]|nr:response regulator transcription factor [Betaproteobacteria bacterium]
MKILVLDDHPLICAGLTLVLGGLYPGTEVLAAAEGRECLEYIASEPRIALVLLDIKLPGSDGISLMARMRELRPDLPVVILTASDDPATVQRAIDAGAAGFITKNVPNSQLIDALRRVLEGEVHLPASVLSTAPPLTTAGGSALGRAREAHELHLSPRQMEVLTLLVQGLSNKAICRTLGMADGTVKTHIAAIMRTLDVSTRTQVVYELSRLGVRLAFPHVQAKGRAA